MSRTPVIHQKYNQQHNDALLAEADGLQTLSHFIKQNHIKLNIPTVHSVSPDCLEMTAIDSQPAHANLMQQLGHQLANWHQVTHLQCGYHRNNYIGLNPQKNTWSDNWGMFFTEYRLRFQVNLISEPNIKQHFNDMLDQQQQALIDWLNAHLSHFSLLHGDLWSGNVLFDSQQVWLIDPAVYFGDADADLAMTEMFGGFDQSFYAAYNKIKPLSEHYANKKIIYNLYHQLNHYNLFGSGYLPGCQQGFAIISDVLK